MGRLRNINEKKPKKTEARILPQYYPSKQKARFEAGYVLEKIGVPYGIRTRVASVKGMCPRPLDEGDAMSFEVLFFYMPGGGKASIILWIMPVLGGLGARFGARVALGGGGRRGLRFILA